MGLRLASLTGQRLLVDSAPGASTGSWHQGASAASWGAAAGRIRGTELLSCHVARATPSIYRCALQQALKTPVFGMDAAEGFTLEIH